MKIGFLVDEFPVLSQTFVLHQITGMLQRGHSIHIYSNKTGNMAKVHAEVEKYHLLEKTSYFSMPGNHSLRLVKALKFIISNGWRNPNACLRALNIFKYGRKAASLKLLYLISPFINQLPDEIIHCQLGFLGLQGLLLREIGAIQGKLVVSFRGTDLSLYLQMFGSQYYQELFKKAELFLPVSEKMKSKLIEIGCPEDKIIVHHSGIDPQQFTFTPRTIASDETIRIVTIARLVEKKGIEYGIRAIALVVQKHPKLEYLILGDGDLMATLQGLIDQLHMSRQVKLLGWKERQEIIQILNHAHILIAPSVTSRDGDSEGIPNVLKEAMAMGMPVVSTQHSGIPELVQDGISGFLVPERDAEALAEKLDYLISHPEIWPEMGKAGRTFVEQNYNIHKLNDRLEEIYQELLRTV